MFDNLKNLAGLPGMLSKAKEMQERMGGMHEQLAESLADLRIDADAGGGMVTATCNGKMELVNLKIDPARLGLGSASEGDLELLEDLIVAAVAAAQTKAAEAAREKTAEEMKKITDDLDLPPEMLEGLSKGGLG